MTRTKKKDRGGDGRRQPHDEDKRMREVHGRLPPAQHQREFAQIDSSSELKPPFASNWTGTYSQHQQEAQIPSSVALNDSGQVLRSLEVEQYTHADSHHGVNNSKKRKIFNNRDTSTNRENSLRFPVHVCAPYDNFIQQYQPPAAMGRPSHQPDDNRTGYQSTAIHAQPRHNTEVTRFKLEDQLDHGFGIHGNSSSVRSGHAGSNTRLRPALDGGNHAQYYPYPQQSHQSDNLNANGDCPGEQEYPRQIADGGLHQDYVGMSTQADQAGAVHQPQMTGMSNGSCLHDSDYRRNKPPFKGKVEMRKEEAALNEVTTIQSLEGDRFHEDNVCNQCGHFGHWLGDCVFPDDNGYIKGCPIHNAKGHTWDECPDARKMSLERKIMYVILRRRNKPAIQSTHPWIALVKVALQQGSEAYCWGPSVWTREFVMKMIRGPKADHPWLDFNYGRQLISTLPKDPETMDDPGVLVERRLLWNQVHRPLLKRGEPDDGF